MIEPRLSVSQLARAWGVSRQHVYILVNAGKLRAIRIGTLLRFRPEDVIEYEERECRDRKPISRPTLSGAETGASMSSGGKTGARIGYRLGLLSRQKRGG